LMAILDSVAPFQYSNIPFIFFFKGDS
jgi:hypothetical protein